MFHVITGRLKDREALAKFLFLMEHTDTWDFETDNFKDKYRRHADNIVTYLLGIISKPIYWDHNGPKPNRD